MNQGKLEVVKQEMARVNINILGISELKRMGMGEFISGDQGIFPTQGSHPGLPPAGRFCTVWATREKPKNTGVGSLSFLQIFPT